MVYPGRPNAQRPVGVSGECLDQTEPGAAAPAEGAKIHRNNRKKAREPPLTALRGPG
jgi:hypothetical protein